MKFQLSHLFLFSICIPLAEGLCLKEALIEEGYWFDDPTLGFEDGIPCTFGKVKRVFKKMMSALDECGSLVDEIKDVFETDKLKRAKAIIKNACDAAPASSEATSSFREILDLPYNDDVDEGLSEEEAEDRFLKEFYDGNTFINQEVGNHKQLSTRQNGVFGQIKAFDRGVSKKEVVSWPSDDIDNFNGCEMNTVMCCWVTDRVINNGDNNGDCKGPYPNRKPDDGESNCIDADPADNTDLCYVDMERSPQANHVEGGFALFPGDVEEGTHCHGFIWSDDQDDASNVYKANNLFYVSMEDHLRTRGYVRNVPGAPMCGCLEQMPTVSRADCTQTSVKYLYDFKYTGESPDFLIATVIGRKVSFNACDGETNNDLESKYDQMVENGEITRSDYFADIVVGEDNCADGIDKFLQDKGFTKVN